MPASTFDVIERRKRITVFKLGKLWVFKHFFDNKELFKALLDHYNKDLRSYVVRLPKSARYAQILKNSVAFKETANERLFLMKDLAAVEEAVGLGARVCEDEVAF